MRVFIDTSALIAYYNIDDLHHSKALDVFTRMGADESSITRLFTTDFVFDETITVLECVLKQPELALQVGEALLNSPFTTLLRVDEDIFYEAWIYFKNKRGYSFTDCTSFIAMKRLGITCAFTLDSHFRSAGFQTLP